jgi:hypothetical protein
MFDKTDIVSIDFSNQLRFEGSQVSGSIKLNTTLAKEKDVTAIKVSLRAIVHTYARNTFSFNSRQSCSSWVQVTNGNQTDTVIEKEPLFTFEQTLWTHEIPLPDHPYAVISLPFAFTMPISYVNGSPLPPSLSCGGVAESGRIQYYVHCVSIHTECVNRYLS